MVSVTNQGFTLSKVAYPHKAPKEISVKKTEIGKRQVATRNVVVMPFFEIRKIRSKSGKEINQIGVLIKKKEEAKS